MESCNGQNWKGEGCFFVALDALCGGSFVSASMAFFGVESIDV